MNTNPTSRRANRGFILWIYLGLMGLGIAALAGVMSYAMKSAELAARNSEYITATYVAESAIEKIRTNMRLDERALGEPGVYAKLGSYVTNWLPTASDSSFFTNYGFSKPIVYKTASWTPIPLSPPLTGTNYGCKYQIIVTASNKYSQFQVPATVGLEINMVDQSIYHYSVFYGLGMDMEVCPGNDMTIRGSVYGGDDIYLNPSGHTLTISDDISAVSQIVKSNSPLDPSGYRTGGTVNTNGGSTTNAAPLVFTLSTNQSSIASNNPAAVHAVLDIPPTGEDPFGAIGTNRYYNKADVIITVKDSNIVVQISPFHTTTHTTVTLTDFPMGTNANAIIYTNDTLYDKRQGSYVKLTTVDIGNLIRYTSNTASGLAVATGSTNINTLYVVDQRTTNSVSVLTWQTTNTVNKILSTPPYTLQSMTITTNKGVKTTNCSYTYVSRTNTYSSSMPAVMLTNGTQVPYGGLTVATPDPVYIKGNYNTTRTGSNPNDNTSTVTNIWPSSVMADAITILSSSWNNNYYNTNTGVPTAVNTTINAAFLTGNVPSNGRNYSGGIENFIRYLETWTGYTNTYNGSMVCVFPSQIANQPWNGSGYYNPPSRNWTYDTNFLGGPASQPPNAPLTPVFSRGRWSILPLGSTNF